jgi:hypothetical protein
MATRSATTTSSRTTQRPSWRLADYPPLHGEFVLRCNDSRTFHCSRFLVLHVSPVFRDMYERSRSVTNEESITLIEDVGPIMALLTFIDPAMRNEPLNWGSVENFLEVAAKYQIQGAVDWFEREVQAEILRRRNEE